MRPHAEGEKLTSAEGVATNLENFGTDRWMTCLRPLATKEGKRERNVVAVMVEAGTRDVTDPGVRDAGIRPRYVRGSKCPVRIKPGGDGIASAARYY